MTFMYINDVYQKCSSKAQQWLMCIDEKGLFVYVYGMCCIPDFPRYLSLNQLMLEMKQPYVTLQQLLAPPSFVKYPIR